MWNISVVADRRSFRLTILAAALRGVNSFTVNRLRTIQWISFYVDAYALLLTVFLTAGLRDEGGCNGTFHIKLWYYLVQRLQKVSANRRLVHTTRFSMACKEVYCVALLCRRTL